MQRPSQACGPPGRRSKVQTPAAPPGRGKAEPQAPASRPPHTPCSGPGWQVPGLALPPCTELLDGLGPGQCIAVAVVHLDAVIADAHGVRRHDPWVQDKGRAR